MNTSTGVVTVSSISGKAVGTYDYNYTVSDGIQPDISSSFSLYVMANPSLEITPITFRGANLSQLSDLQQATLINSVGQQILAVNPSATINYINLSSGSVKATVGSTIPITVPVMTIDLGDGITLSNEDICLLSTSNIKMSDGTYKNIKDVVKGDLVVSALNGAQIRVLHCGYQIVTTPQNKNYPICIPKNFFGNETPLKDVLISGYHRIFFGINNNTVGIHAYRVFDNFLSPKRQVKGAWSGLNMWCKHF
jgi:hypothetical protein